MRRILIADLVKDDANLSNLLFRMYHHFCFVQGVKFYILRGNIHVGKNLKRPEYFGNDKRDNSFEKFINEKVVYKTVVVDSDIREISKNTTHLIIASEAFYKKNHKVLKINTPKLYWCDPEKTRQEGSNYIQAALDLLPVATKKENEKESLEKFESFSTTLKGKYKESVLLATGPSIEKYHEYKLDEMLSIACNSTILDDDLVNFAKPKILVFADPIFHFGISKYSSNFRKICREFLTSHKELRVIIPIKYYALLKSLLPGYENQIIGVPFTKNKAINLEINSENFYTFTTANILTLLLLPLATTFTKHVNLIGCDGRDLRDDDYFWGHGKTVQLHSEMDNIQQCHPGFFKIDYNEYYFQHCHTLDNILTYAETKGKTFKHLGRTYIPTLKERSVNNPLKNLESAVSRDAKFCIIEPDGLNKESGHYLNWHTNLVESLSKVFNNSIELLVNKTSSYSTEHVKAHKVFTRNSWQVQRESDSQQTSFPFGASMKIFFNELTGFLKKQTEKEVHLFMYYGSVQIVKACIEIEKQFPEIKFRFTICIFSESVSFDASCPQKNFHPDSKNILTEAAAKKDSFRLLTVTKELSEYIYSMFEVKLPDMVNPIINLNDSLAALNFANFKSPLEEKIEVFLPTRLSYGKSDANLVNVLQECISKNSNLILKLRTSEQANYLYEKMNKLQKDKQIKILPELKTHTAYIEELAKSDIIFIPYPKKSFLARSSGILNDAIIARKPLITMAGTWLSRVSKQNNAGLYISSLTANSLLCAIDNIKENYSFFKTNIAASSSRLQIEQSFGILAKQCISEHLNQFSNYGGIDTNTSPKALFIHQACIGSMSATGQLLQNLSKGLPLEFSEIALQIDKMTERSFKSYDLNKLIENINTNSELKSIFNTEAPDIVIIRPDKLLASIIPALIKLKDTFKFKIIVSLMDIEIDGANNAHTLMLDLFNNADIFWFISNEMKAYFLNEYNTFSCKPSYVIANGIDANQINTEYEYGYEPLTEVICRFTGSINEYQTYEGLKIFSEVISRFNGKIKFEIYSRQAKTELAKTLEKYANVTLYPPLKDNNEYLALIQKADVLVIPYGWGESCLKYLQFSFGNKIPEYLSVGKPVIALGDAKLNSMAFLKSKLHENAFTEESQSILETKLAERLTYMIDNYDTEIKKSKALSKAVIKDFDINQKRALFLEMLTS